MTINNYDEYDIDTLTKDNHKYIVIGDEIGEKGTKHLQITICYTNAITFKTIKNKYPKAHIEVCKNLKKSIEYCKKEKFHEIGIPPIKPGKRTDIETVKIMLNEGKAFHEVIQECSSYQALKFAETFSKYTHNNKLRQNLQVTWLWGESGVGKTKTAIEMTNNEPYWISGRNLKWWDGYNGQNYVIIDDFRSDFCTYHELLRILDIYPLRVEIKGSSIPMTAENIIITSCHNPDDCYHTHEDKTQLMRRINNIVHMAQRSG